MNVIISEKGWIVIPSHLRKKYKLTAGTEVKIVDHGGVLTLIPKLHHPMHEAGMLKGRKSLTKALLAEHRRELVRGK